MRTFLFFLLMLAGIQASAQRFALDTKLKTADSLTFENVYWSDLDNDSLLDVLAAGKNAANELVLVLYKSSLADGLTYTSTHSTGIISSLIYLTDLDADNQIDIIVSGADGNATATWAFMNLGGFAFEKRFMLDQQVSSMALADLTQDGQRELIVSGVFGGGPAVRIYRGQEDSWTLAHDSIALAAQSMDVFNFDFDSDNDLFVSGVDSLGNRRTIALYNKNDHDLAFTQKVLMKLAGKSSVSDLNHDGMLDVVITGIDSVSATRTVLFQNKRFDWDSLEMPALQNATLFTGDLDSNGQCDLVLQGTNTGNDTINLVRYSDESFDSLRHTDVVAQAFGDIDRDGDLDLVQVTSDSLVLLLNTTDSVNLPPSRPFGVMVAQLLNRFFLYWHRPSDDHTKDSVLTYDITVHGADQSVATGSFDLVHKRKLLVNHGNLTMNNYLILRDDSPDRVFYIQAIDNAYNASQESVCVGNGNGPSGEPCVFEVPMEEITACTNEDVVLTQPEGTMWFSFADGFLATSSTQVVEKSDTVFAVIPGTDEKPCGSIVLYMIQFTDTLTKETFFERYACEGSVLEFSAEEAFTVTWSSFHRGFLSNEHSIAFNVISPDTVTVHLSDGKGCNLTRNTAIKISKPQITSTPSDYQILKGQSVQMEVGATGASSYMWSPQAGLNDPTISNPIATPSATTQYTLQVFDSLGCSELVRVLIIVEETAFVPNLFTPNGDGSNDELRIYGLPSANNFTFSIYNREGSLVYTSRSVSEVMSTGWNGVSNGVRQPSGVYYWKVQGDTAAGGRVQLNGKNTGAIVLIR